MSIIPEPNLDALLGKKSVWKPLPSITCVHYIAGFDSFDNIVNAKSIFFSADMYTHIYARPSGVEFDFIYKFKSHKLGLLNDDIITVSILNNKTLNGYNKKDLIEKAFANDGGILSAPDSTDSRRATGSRIKEIKVDSLMVIIYNYNGQEHAAVFNCHIDKMETLYKEAQAVFTYKFDL